MQFPTQNNLKIPLIYLWPYASAHLSTAFLSLILLPFSLKYIPLRFWAKHFIKNIFTRSLNYHLSIIIINDNAFIISVCLNKMIICQSRCLKTYQQLWIQLVNLSRSKTFSHLYNRSIVVVMFFFFFSLSPMLLAAYFNPLFWILIFLDYKC